MSAATPAEWAAAGSLGITALGVLGLAMAFVDADLAYFDPRPTVRRAVKSARRLPRATALTAAALLTFFLPTPESTR